MCSRSSDLFSYSIAMNKRKQGAATRTTRRGRAAKTPGADTEPQTGGGAFAVAAGGLVMVRVGAAVMVMLTGPLAVWVPASVALTVRFDVPATVGVPLTAHPAPSVRPAGRVPAVMEQL